MGLIKAAPVTFAFLISEAAFLALMTEPEAWIRPLIRVIAMFAYALTVYGTGMGMGLNWPWNTIVVLLLVVAIDLGIGALKARVGGGRAVRSHSAQ